MHYWSSLIVVRPQLTEAFYERRTRSFAPPLISKFNWPFRVLGPCSTSTRLQIERGDAASARGRGRLRPLREDLALIFGQLPKRT